jgi:hypothetical protein
MCYGKCDFIRATYQVRGDDGVLRQNDVDRQLLQLIRAGREMNLIQNNKSIAMNVRLIASRPTITDL